MYINDIKRIKYNEVSKNKGSDYMEITVAVVIMAITLVAGQITKLTKLDNKWIPLQNLIIAIVSSIVCIIFKVQNMDILETIITCIFGSMSAGGIADMKNMMNKEKK